MFCADTISDLLTFAGTSGHPLFATVPAISGQRSSSSLIPSPSLSGAGHPSYLARPAWFGHLSFSSLIPSPSESGTGQPSYFARPATFGHLSRLSAMPSPSLSGITTGGGVVTVVALKVSFFLPNNLSLIPAWITEFLYSTPGV